MTEGRSHADTSALVEAMAKETRRLGLPLERMSLSFQTLHPEVVAMAYVWRESEPDVLKVEVDLETQSSNRYLMSPIRVIYDGGHRVWCKLEGDDPDLEYGFLEDLRDQGYTDYAVLAMPITGGRQAPFTMAIKRPGGFTDADIAGMEMVCQTLGFLAEIHAHRHLAGSLLDVYLGHGTGERVLQGAIRRGSVQRFPAALFFCDLRNFTALSERLQRNFIVHVLNDYFGEVGRAIDGHDGEILKFIGDAALAIFPVADDDRAGACNRALAAAQDLLSNLAELNTRRTSEDKSPLEVGLGLHVGEVWYGNIGAQNRMDFTVIGPAVNRAARLEQLASRLGEKILVSAEFAETVDAPFEKAGDFDLKGIDGQTPAFRPT